MREKAGTAQSRWNFGALDHGLVYTTPGVLATDRVQLFQREKRIMLQELGGLGERAFEQDLKEDMTDPQTPKTCWTTPRFRHIPWSLPT